MRYLYIRTSNVVEGYGNQTRIYHECQSVSHQYATTSIKLKKIQMNMSMYQL